MANIDRAQTAYIEALNRYQAGCESAAPEEFRALQISVSDARLDLEIAIGLLERCQTLSIEPIRPTVIEFECFNCGFPFRCTREWLAAARSTECPYCAGTISFHF
jgi:DNA-directed RNA polymerase subunit RPC12/RpoP